MSWTDSDALACIRGTVMEADLIRVIFQPMNKVATVPRGMPLLAALRDAGIPIESICGGKGLCRKCKVILTKGECVAVPQVGSARLTAEERAQGYHFACQVKLTSDSEFTIPVESRIDSPQILLSSEMQIATLSPSVEKYRVEVSTLFGLPSPQRSMRLAGYKGPRPKVDDQIYEQIRASQEPLSALLSMAHTQPEIIGIEPEKTSRPLYGIALDLGTSTVVGCLIDLSTGEIVETGSTLNRQITYGEELITRIGYAGTPEGRAALQHAAVESISMVIAQLVSTGQTGNSDIVDMTIGGNTVMNHLLTGIDVTPLEMANVSISRHPILMKASAIGISLHPGAYVYCLPNVSRFVGGDAVGDVIASGMHTSDELSLLIDLGTNGEIIIGNKEWLASVSCASGPAFEGSGIRFGMRAMRGAIEHVRIDPETSEVTYSVIGNILPRGICGSGIIDVASGMVSAGVLDFAGKLIEDHPHVRAGPEGLEYVLVQKEKTGISRDIAITQHDIDYLMDSKAAACGGIGVLLNRYRISPADIQHVYFAGAFGAYADISNAVSFGILPEFPTARFHHIGNGSLSGAYAALVSRKYRKEAEVVAHKMVYIDLLVDVDFIEEYSAALYIPGKCELFPGHYQKQEK